MPDAPTFLAFALASAVLAVTPGPAIVLVIAVATERGRRAASATAIGLAAGTSVWGVAASLGLGTVLAARPQLLRSVTLVGAAYLVWLAVRSVRGPGDPTEPDLDGMPAAGAGTVVALRDGAVVNLLNPSIAVFLAAVLPPFLDTSAGSVTVQSLWLSAVLVVVSTAVNLTWGTVGAGVGGAVRRWAGDRRTSWVVAGTYLALAAVAVVAALG